MESSGLRMDTARPHGTREGFDLIMDTSEAQLARAGIQRGMGISPAPGLHYRTIENTLTQELCTVGIWERRSRIAGRTVATITIDKASPFDLASDARPPNWTFPPRRVTMAL